MKQDKGLTAKDTVMSDEDVKAKLLEYSDDEWIDIMRNIHPHERLWQAEVTWGIAFKEGVDKTHKACDETYGEMLKEAIKAERRRIMKGVGQYFKGGN